MSSGSAVMRLNMRLQVVPPRWMYFLMFTISGFSGLIYESIWSHYLKLFLGHAAFAQSLVLMIFMGGMAGGSWLASRYSNRWKAPLLAYAIVEVVIGVLALAFHEVFQGMIDTFYLSILPGLDSPALGSVLKWSAAAALIVPQSLLLGMTFPLMSAGILRRYPSTPGGSIAMLYFTNSIGAAVGVLASGFWLIGAVGLPGTIFTAGLLNISLALAVWILVKLDPEPFAPPLEQAAEETKEDSQLANLFLIAAFITGAASFIYEIGWIRMLSLVLGSTTHSFELMLSAFITGLAFGGLWIKRRIDDIGNPVAFSGRVQLLMGGVALMTLPIYFMSFEWMQGLMGAVNRNESGFAIFNLGSHIIALAVMLPATFLAGMTLPLFTHVLIQRQAGERAIGRIYAANTCGAIAGVLFAIHVGLPLLGLKTLIAFGATLDILLGIFLLNYSAQGKRPVQIGAVALVCVGVIVGTMTMVDLDPARLTSGVYRHGNVDGRDGDILYYRDGKTATISLYRSPDNSIAIATNGKPDASLFIDDTGRFTVDEITMALAGVIPLTYKPDSRVVGNIGLGSGLTSHTLLANPDLEIVDTIEIEPVMAIAAQGFGDRVARTFTDPRSRIHIEDAKTFFSLNNKRYDFIIAEPSNPWVSGVSSLFTDEFYRTVTNYIVEDGLFVQWLQLYEFEDRLIFSVLKALEPHFSDFAIYSAGGADILVVAKRSGQLGEPNTDVVMTGQMAKDLARIGFASGEDILVRKLADKASVEAMFSFYRVPPNSDYYPFLDLNAGKARFKGQTARLFHEWAIAPLPVMEMVQQEELDFAALAPQPDFPRTSAIQTAAAVYTELTGDGDASQYANARTSLLLYFAMQNLKLAAQQCDEPRTIEWQSAWFRVATGTLPYLNPPQAEKLVRKVTGLDCGAQLPPTDMAWTDLYLAVARRDAADMAAAANVLLAEDQALGDPEQRAYVLTAGMLGLLNTERPHAALSLWQSFGEAQFAMAGVPEYTRLVLQLADRDAT